MDDLNLRFLCKIAIRNEDRMESANFNDINWGLGKPAAYIC